MWEAHPGGLTSLPAATPWLALKTTVAVELGPKAVTINTGVGVRIPPGNCGILQTPFSLAQKGVHIPGGPLKPGFQGEIQVPIVGPTTGGINILPGQVIAHLFTVRLHDTISSAQTAKDQGVGARGERSLLRAGARIWWRQENGPPLKAETIATGKDSTLIILVEGEEKWRYVPSGKCFLRE